MCDTNDQHEDILNDLQSLNETSDKNFAPVNDETDIEKWNATLEYYMNDWKIRNSKLSEFFINYIDERQKKKKRNRWFSIVLFLTFIILLLGLTGGMVTGIIFIVKLNVSVESVVALFTIGLTYMGSLITILKIMAQYLFPVTEEQDTATMIKYILETDLEYQKLFKQKTEKKD
ncbi:MAG: hypothetical protein HFJ84_09945 [Clostridiales bacterium]|jgi:ABC-type multidrug transport system fused ATPase/permease subunit|nr:hypothetical protein [Clostridiales bacterium]